MQSFRLPPSPIDQFRQIATNMARHTAPMRKKVRNFSGSPEEARESMAMMKKATAGGVGVVSVLCVVNLFIHMSHEHGHELPKYSYLQIYNKPFPWKESKCNLFDLDCKAKARAMMK